MLNFLVLPSTYAPICQPPTQYHFLKHAPFPPCCFFFQFLGLLHFNTFFILIDPGFDISKTHVFHCVLFPRRFHYISVCPLPQSHFVFFIFSFDCLIIDRHSSHAHVIPVTARLKRKRGVGGMNIKEYLKNYLDSWSGCSGKLSMHGVCFESGSVCARVKYFHFFGFLWFSHSKKSKFYK